MIRLLDRTVVDELAEHSCAQRGGHRRLHEPQSTNDVVGVGVSTPCGPVSTRGTPDFVPVLLSCTCVEGYDPRKRHYPPRARHNSTNPGQSAISQWDWGFHTVRAVIDPRDHRFRPRFVGVVEV